MAMTDALGHLVRFELLPGNRTDTIGVAPLIKNINFGKLKEFKRIAMRSDKTDQSFSAMIYAASAIITAR
jgi:hypothetical protein